MCAHAKTPSLIDAIREFEEIDGGSGGRKIRRGKKKADKEKKARGASIKLHNQIVFPVFGLFFISSFSVSHLFLPSLSVISRLTRTHMHAHRHLLYDIRQVR